ncbi:hypothetical protein T4D_8229 [Trichinella pseudospiralis]|uniref:Uncharacterized protein n=1 Tax=Trichinella pseudospiralis TaxID=6337 RepID=A0A0V1DQ28_TRIPS|nr:hypothetical protein T4D_8229 [Trichinella pseudospiralis]
MLVVLENNFIIRTSSNKFDKMPDLFFSHLYKNKTGILHARSF